MTGKTVLIGNNALVGSLDVLGFVGWFSHEDRKKNDSHGPNIDFEGMSPSCFITLNNLRGDVIGSSANRFSLFVGMFQLGGQSKITNLDTNVTIQEEITQFQVTMNDAIFVEILNSTK